jgi:hypothetical protein
MAFVELDRSFFPLNKDHEPSLDAGRIWGRKLGGWLEWSDLRERRRVVLLAEASSGKSEEFKNQVKQLNAEDKAAFYLPIEELADQGFEAALDGAGANDSRDGQTVRMRLGLLLGRKRNQLNNQQFVRLLVGSIDLARRFLLFIENWIEKRTFVADRRGLRCLPSRKPLEAPRRTAKSKSAVAADLS